MVDLPRRELSDIESLKALAHPLRQQMLAWLKRRGPATSADLAAELDADRGAASYHLRQLARYGFIEEDTARSAGRRRYWRAVAQDVRLPRHPPSIEAEQAVQDILRGWREQAASALERFLAAPDAFGELGAAALQSNGSLTLTAEELTQFGEEYLDLLTRWRQLSDAPAAGRRHVTVLFSAFPTPDASQP